MSRRHNLGMCYNGDVSYSRVRRHNLDVCYSGDVSYSRVRWCRNRDRCWSRVLYHRRDIIKTGHRRLMINHVVEGLGASGGDPVVV